MDNLLPVAPRSRFEIPHGAGGSRDTFAGSGASPQVSRCSFDLIVVVGDVARFFTVIALCGLGGRAGQPAHYPLRLLQLFRLEGDRVASRNSCSCATVWIASSSWQVLYSPYSCSSLLRVSSGR